MEDISLAEFAHLVVVHVCEGILLCSREDRASLDDQLVPDKLVLLQLEHSLFDGVLSDEPIDSHCLCLADSVGSIHSL